MVSKEEKRESKSASKHLRTSGDGRLPLDELRVELSLLHLTSSGDIGVRKFFIKY